MITFIFIIILIPFFKPVGIAIYPGINMIFRIGKIFSLAFGIIYIIQKTQLKIRISRFSKGILAFAIFELIYIANTIINKTGFFDVVNNSVTNLVLLSVIYLALKSKKRAEFIIAINRLFTIELILHIVSVILAEVGYGVFEVVAGEDTYLFGRDNYSAFATLPMLGVVLYTDTIKQGKHTQQSVWKGYALTGGLLVCYLWTKSATASMALFLLFCSLLFGHFRKLLRFFSVDKVMILIVGFLIAVIGFDVQVYFAGALGRVFDKGIESLTLTARTIIWDFALKLIIQKPLLGWGELSGEQISNYALYGTSHAHNIILEILLRTGLLGLTSYICFLHSACRKYKKIIKTNGVVLITTLMCFWVLTTMDAYLLMQPQYCLIGFIFGWKYLEGCSNYT